MMRALTLLAVVCAVSAEDYKRWKEMRAQRTVTVRVPMVFEGHKKDLDSCLKVAESFPKPEKYGVYYGNDVGLCQVMKKEKLGTYDESDDTMDWHISNTQLETSTDHNLFVKKDNKEQEDDISTGDIIATIVLAIIFALMMLVCAFLCKEEDSDIANQMQRLEEKEMRMEKAASEDWERRSEAAEEAEKEMADK